MPVIPIVAAAAAWAGAAGAIGAVAAGGLSALTLSGALAITAAVGATLGAVGVITHDKGLMTAGLIIGGIGAIGGLAAGAGLFGEGAGAESLFGAASVPGDVAVTPEIVGSNVGGFMSGDASGGLIDSFGAATNAAPAPAADTTATAATGQLSGGAAADTLSGAADAGAATAPTLPTTAPPIAPIPTAPTLGIDAGPVAPPSPLAQSLQDAGAGTAPVMPSVETPGMLDALGNFVKNDKSGMIGYGMIQAGGSLVSGLFNPVPPAQVENLNANTAATNVQTGLTQNQLDNVKQPLPVATRAVAPTGLINRSA